ncbi:MAG: hypothetical protein HY814_06815 [Candidatus Riflebacteria bacterium]|nr:hypothetical protein [Candidatus Riflebacteria bacterium]
MNFSRTSPGTLGLPTLPAPGRSRQGRRPYCPRVAPGLPPSPSGGRQGWGMLWLILLASSVFVQQPAAGAEPTAAFDPEPALLSLAARRFATASAAGTLSVTAVRRVDRYAEGLRFDTYELRDAAGSSLGRVTRLQVFPDPRSTIDLAVSLEATRVTSVEPLRPVVLAGKPFPELPRLFDAVKGRPAEDFASGMSQFFEALTGLGEAAAGPPRAPARAAPRSARTTPLVSLTQPELRVGEPMPPLDARDVSGRPVAAAAFAGKRTAVLVGNVTEGMTRDMLGALADGVRQRPEMALAVILVNPAATILEYQRYLPGREWAVAQAVPDPSGELRRAFKAPVLPYLHVFDARGKLVKKAFWQGAAELEKDLTATGKEK